MIGGFDRVGSLVYKAAPFLSAQTDHVPSVPGHRKTPAERKQDQPCPEQDAAPIPPEPAEQAFLGRKRKALCAAAGLD